MASVLLRAFSVTLIVVIISQIVSFTIRSFSGQPFTLFVFVMNSILPVMTAFPISVWIFLQQNRLARALGELSRVHAELERRATYDAMTGVLNRETFLKRLADLRRDADAGALLIMDVDYFKAVNDTYGHLVGDKALIAIAEEIGPILRSSDVVGRIGGEEFAVYLPGTPIGSAIAIAHRIRARIEGVEFRPNGEIRHPLTVSIGVGAVSADRKVSEIMREADRRLYLAKERGRNNVVGPDESGPNDVPPSSIVEAR